MRLRAPLTRLLADLWPMLLMGFLFGGGTLVFIALTPDRWSPAEAAIAAGILGIGLRDLVTDPAAPESPTAYLALLALSAVACAHLSHVGAVFSPGEILLLTALTLYCVGKAIVLARRGRSVEEG